MENMAFIQQHLVEKGVPKDLTKFSSNQLSKLLFSETKPLVFQSPVQVFFKQGIILGLVWGLLMWLLDWRTDLDNWVFQLVSVICFGVIMEAYCRIVSLKRTKSWGTLVGKVGVVLTISLRCNELFKNDSVRVVF